MLKTYPGEAPELYSLSVQRDGSQTKSAPDVMSFGY